MVTLPPPPWLGGQGPPPPPPSAIRPPPKARVKKPNAKVVAVQGWFPVPPKDTEANYVSADKLRAVLDRDLFRFGYRVLNPKDLWITDIERIVGSFFNPIFVVGVFDTNDVTGNLYLPFFIEKTKIPKLQRFIRLHKPNDVLYI